MLFVVKTNKKITELFKSYGIRNRIGLVPKKVPVKGKYGYFMRTVYVRQEEVENPKIHTYIEHSDEYEDLPKLLNEIKKFKFEGKSEFEVFEMTRKMGKANSMAFKGNHLRLTDKEKAINDAIYPIKEDFIENLAEYYVKNRKEAKWLKVNKGQFDDVLYVRDTNSGVQISFHGYQNKKGVDIDITTDSSVWDGIYNAFEYDKDSYVKAIETKKQTSIFLKDYQEYAIKYFNEKINNELNKILKSKRIEKMLQDEIKDGRIDDKDQLKVKLILEMPNDWYNDDEIYADHFLDYMKKAKLKIKIDNKLSFKTIENIKQFISGELGKKDIILKSLYTDYFDEMEKSFILEE